MAPEARLFFRLDGSDPNPVDALDVRLALTEISLVTPNKEKAPVSGTPPSSLAPTDHENLVLFSERVSAAALRLLSPPISLFSQAIPLKLSLGQRRFSRCSNQTPTLELPQSPAKSL